MALPSMIFAEVVLKSRSGKSVLDAGVEVTSDKVKTFTADPKKVKKAVTLLKEKGFVVYSIGKSSVIVSASEETYQANLPKVRLVGIETGMSESNTPVIYVRAIPVNANPIALFKKNISSLVASMPGDTVIFTSTSPLSTLVEAFVLCQPEESDAEHNWDNVINGVDRDSKPTKSERELLPPDIPESQLGQTKDERMSRTYSGEGVEIIIVDTGCSSGHPFFRKQTNSITVTTVPDIERALDDKVANQNQAVSNVQQQLIQTQQALQSIDHELERLRQNVVPVTRQNDSEDQIAQGLAEALGRTRTALNEVRNFESVITDIRNRMSSIPESDLQTRKPLIEDLVSKNEILRTKRRASQRADLELGRVQERLRNYRNAQSLQLLQTQRLVKDSQVRTYSRELSKEQQKLTKCQTKLSSYRDVHEDTKGHGTAMAASACAVAPKASINVYKKASNIGPGHPLVWNLIQDRIREGGAIDSLKGRVISCSWSTRSGKDADLHQIPCITQIAELLSKAPILFSAGNQGRADFSIQALNPNIISVGGAWRDDNGIVNGSTTTKTYFSMKKRRVPDVCGWCENKGTKNLLSPINPNTERKMMSRYRGWRKMNGGSSSATAQVAALCAIIKQHWPEATSDDIKVLLVTEAVPVNAGYFAPEIASDPEVAFDALGPVGLISIEKTMSRLIGVKQNLESQKKLRDYYLNIAQMIFEKYPPSNPS